MWKLSHAKELPAKFLRKASLSTSMIAADAERAASDASAALGRHAGASRAHEIATYIIETLSIAL